jgi:hypothetical protein
VTDEGLISEAGRRLSNAAPDADVILFGSRARGEARDDSDLDLLVIEPDSTAEATSTSGSARSSAVSKLPWTWSSIGGASRDVARRSRHLSSPSLGGRPCPLRRVISTRPLGSSPGKQEDATAVREFAENLDISDSIIGFHAQQAVEKWLKALTAGARNSTQADP